MDWIKTAERVEKLKAELESESEKLFRQKQVWTSALKTIQLVMNTQAPVVISELMNRDWTPRHQSTKLILEFQSEGYEKMEFYLFGEAADYNDITDEAELYFPELKKGDWLAIRQSGYDSSLAWALIDESNEAFFEWHEDYRYSD